MIAILPSGNPDELLINNTSYMRALFGGGYINKN
jgi:hypothetical protein